MTLFRTLLFLILAGQIASGTEFEESKVLHAGYIGTQMYVPTKKERKFAKKVIPGIMKFGGLIDKDMLQRKKGDYVSWFAIVRDITRDTKTHGIRFVGESKYFTGMGDVHIQTVSIDGAGDFVVQCNTGDYDMAPVVLVRVYGRVKEFDEEKRPVISADYIRVWPWTLFNFSDIGKEAAADSSAPKRREGLHLDKIRIYNMHPEMPEYYQERLVVSPEELEAEHQWWLKNEKRINAE